MQLFKLSPVFLLIISCTVGPDYQRPPVTIPSEFKEAKTNYFKSWKKAKPCTITGRGKWWTIFKDSTLDHLEEELNSNNQTIANAIANYYQSLALVDQARASYFPTLIGSASVFRRRGSGTPSFISTSNTSGIPVDNTVSSGGGQGVGSLMSTNYSAFLNANWEPDLWGLVKRTVEANVAFAYSNLDLLGATRLSAQGSLAQYYFELRTLDSDQMLLDKTVRDYKKTLRLTQNRYKAGTNSKADVLQAFSQLQTAQSAAINNHILRGQYEHAIAVLIGRPVANFCLPPKPLTTILPKVPLTVPSTLLERRPDVAQAERLIEQANAQIGIAQTAYYPVLNLSSSVNVATNNFSKLFSSPTIGWSLGSQLVETIFDGGLRYAIVNAAKAGYWAQVANYRQSILTAFQNVEDSLIALEVLNKLRKIQNQAVITSQIALKLVINQYRARTVPYSSVITAQITAYNTEKNAIDVKGLQLTNTVALIKALGGGWKQE